jgi:uncharacterized cupredoxin-like copper-binding protein
MGRRYTPSIAAIILTVAVTLGACSNGERSTTTSEPQPPDVEVSMTEWRFLPVETVIAAGSETVFEIRNSGEILHEWALVEGYVENERDLDARETVVRLEVQPGAVDRVVVPALQPGTYGVVCPIPGHIANGMVGTLRVES